MRIAIVDDDITFINYALRILNNKENLSIDTFLVGNKFLNALELNKYDVICMDYDMPSYNGYDLIELVRSNRILKEPLFILITHHSSLSLIKEGYKYNIFRFITKDLFASEIFDALKAAKKNLNIGKTMTFKISREIRAFKLDDLLAVYSEGHEICILTNENDKVYRSRIPIKNITEELLKNDFGKAKSNTYINLHHIKHIKKHSVLLNNGMHFIVSKDCYKELLQLYLEIDHV